MRWRKARGSLVPYRARCIYMQIQIQVQIEEGAPVPMLDRSFVVQQQQNEPVVFMMPGWRPGALGDPAQAMQWRKCMHPPGRLPAARSRGCGDPTLAYSASPLPASFSVDGPIVRRIAFDGARWPAAALGRL